MNVIIIFTVDSPLKSFGGLGEAVRNLCFNLPEYKFISFGYADEDKQEEKNITHYKISEKIDNTEKITPELVEKIKNIIDTEKNIIAINIFDFMYIEIGAHISELYKKEIIYCIQLSATKKIESIYKAWKPIMPEAVEKMLERNKSEIKRVEDLENFIFDKASFLIFISEYYRQLFIKNRNYAKYKIIHNGIDFEEYSKIIEKDKFTLPGKEGNTKILFMGRFDTMKNITTLLETRVPENIDLIIAGSSKAGDIPFIEEVIEKLPNVYNVGFLVGDKKKYFLQNVDAVIVPSIHEPFGIIVLETIASKTILICSRQGGMAEIVSPEMCIECGIHSPTIYNAYLRLLNMTTEEKERMKTFAYNKIKHLTWAENARKYKKIYESIKDKNVEI